MAQHWIYINSPGYRRFVEASKERRWILYSTGAALAAFSMAAGYVTMNVTNKDFEEEGYKSKQAELAKLPLQAQLVARTNREQLRAMMLDVTSNTDSDRYRALLDGKIHNTTHGTSMPDAKLPPAPPAKAK